MSVCVAAGGSNGSSCGRHVYVPCLCVCCSGWKQWQKLFMFHICVLQWVEAMAEAVYVPYLCVAVGGSNGRMFMFHICVLQWVEAMAEAVYVPYLCVAVGGSNGSSWGRHVYVPCLCVLQWVEAMAVAVADMFTFHVLCVLQWAEAMAEAVADMFTFHVCVCVVVGGGNGRSWGRHVYVQYLCVEVMAEAGADMFTFHVCVCCRGWKRWQKLGPTCLRSMFVCVAVGGSNGRRWGRHVYVPCLFVLQRVEAVADAGADMFTFHVCVCCSGWKQWQTLGPTCLRSMFVCVAVGGSNGRRWGRHVYVPCLCVLQRVEAMAVAVADMFTFHVCVCCSGWKQWQTLGPTCLRSMFVCVAVGGSSGRRWGRHVYVPCLCVLRWVEAVAVAVADMFTFHVCVCCSGRRQ